MLHQLQDHCSDVARSFQITVDDNRLEQVNCFAYPGNKFNQNTECTDNMKTRLIMGTEILIKLTKTWKSIITDL